MKKLAIIGASYLQNPLILKAREMGLETHVFAWAAGDVGEKTADFFYPISIVEKEAILEKCREIGVDGIATIGSDLAMVPVAYVAEQMGLVSNSVPCVRDSTNKSRMRRVFEERGDPSPRSATVTSADEAAGVGFDYPIIVKPADRSGSRGVAKLDSSAGLARAVDAALKESFVGAAVVEEYVDGREFSVEHISWRGAHGFLAVTEKFTTGAPRFVETGHLEPARVGEGDVERMRSVVSRALTSLGIEYGASHAEVKINSRGEVRIIEIGPRMGGDFIGSDLVQLSTGYDFTRAVVDVALGNEPQRVPSRSAPRRYAAVRFVTGEADARAFDKLRRENPGLLVRHEVGAVADTEVKDSSSRSGYFLFASDALADVEAYLPDAARDL